MQNDKLISESKEKRIELKKERLKSYKEFYNLMDVSSRIIVNNFKRKEDTALYDKATNPYYPFQKFLDGLGVGANFLSVLENENISEAEIDKALNSIEDIFKNIETINKKYSEDKVLLLESNLHKGQYFSLDDIDELYEGFSELWYLFKNEFNKQKDLKNTIEDGIIRDGKIITYDKLKEEEFEEKFGKEAEEVYEEVIKGKTLSPEIIEDVANKIKEDVEEKIEKEKKFFNVNIGKGSTKNVDVALINTSYFEKQTYPFSDYYKNKEDKEYRYKYVTDDKRKKASEILHYSAREYDDLVKKRGQVASILSYLEKEMMEYDRLYKEDPRSANNQFFNTRTNGFNDYYYKKALYESITNFLLPLHLVFAQHLKYTTVHKKVEDINQKVWDSFYNDTINAKDGKGRLKNQFFAKFKQVCYEKFGKGYEKLTEEDIKDFYDSPSFQESFIREFIKKTTTVEMGLNLRSIIRSYEKLKRESQSYYNYYRQYIPDGRRFRGITKEKFAEGDTSEKKWEVISENFKDRNAKLYLEAFFEVAYDGMFRLTENLSVEFVDGNISKDVADSFKDFQEELGGIFKAHFSDIKEYFDPRKSNFKFLNKNVTGSTNLLKMNDKFSTNTIELNFYYDYDRLEKFLKGVLIDTLYANLENKIKDLRFSNYGAYFKTIPLLNIREKFEQKLLYNSHLTFAKNGENSLNSVYKYTQSSLYNNDNRYFMGVELSEKKLEKNLKLLYDFFVEGTMFIKYAELSTKFTSDEYVKHNSNSLVKRLLSSNTLSLNKEHTELELILNNHRDGDIINKLKGLLKAYDRKLALEFSHIKAMEMYVEQKDLDPKELYYFLHLAGVLNPFSPQNIGKMLLPKYQNSVSIGEKTEKPYIMPSFEVDKYYYIGGGSSVKTIFSKPEKEMLETPERVNISNDPFGVSEGRVKKARTYSFKDDYDRFLRKVYANFSLRQKDEMSKDEIDSNFGYFLGEFTQHIFNITDTELDLEEEELEELQENGESLESGKKVVLLSIDHITGTVKTLEYDKEDSELLVQKNHYLPNHLLDFVVENKYMNYSIERFSEDIVDLIAYSSDSNYKTQKEIDDIYNRLYEFGIPMFKEYFPEFFKLRNSIETSYFSKTIETDEVDEFVFEENSPIFKIFSKFKELELERFRLSYEDKEEVENFRKIGRNLEAKYVDKIEIKNKNVLDNDREKKQTKNEDYMKRMISETYYYENTDARFYSKFLKKMQDNISLYYNRRQGGAFYLPTYSDSYMPLPQHWFLSGDSNLVFDIVQKFYKEHKELINKEDIIGNHSNFTDLHLKYTNDFIKLLFKYSKVDKEKLVDFDGIAFNYNFEQFIKNGYSGRLSFQYKDEIKEKTGKKEEEIYVSFSSFGVNLFHKELKKENQKFFSFLSPMMKYMKEELYNIVGPKLMFDTFIQTVTEFIPKTIKFDLEQFRENNGKDENFIPFLDSKIFVQYLFSDLHNLIEDGREKDMKELVKIRESAKDLLRIISMLRGGVDYTFYSGMFEFYKSPILPLSENSSKINVWNIDSVGGDKNERRIKDIEELKDKIMAMNYKGKNVNFIDGLIDVLKRYLDDFMKDSDTFKRVFEDDEMKMIVETVDSLKMGSLSNEIKKKTIKYQKDIRKVNVELIREEEKELKQKENNSNVEK